MLDIVDPDERIRTLLLEKFRDQIPDAILVSSSSGFEVLERAFKSGRPVIAYGPEPHRLGDARYLDAFRTYNYVYIHMPEGAESFTSAYRQMMKRREASVSLLPAKAPTGRPRRRK
jgi:hypothetical protein